MKTSTFVLGLLLAIVLGAASAAVVSTSIVRSMTSGHGPEPDGEGAAVAPMTGPSLAGRVQALEEENAALMRRIEALEIRPAPQTRLSPDGAVSEEAFESFAEEVRSWMASVAAPNEVPPELQATVETALSSIRKKEQLEEQGIREQRRAEKIEKQLERGIELLGLDTYQVGQMRTLLTTQAARDDELMSAWEAGGSAEELGEVKRGYQEEYQAELTRILTPQQLETLNADQARRSGKK